MHEACSRACEPASLHMTIETRNCCKESTQPLLSNLQARIMCQGIGRVEAMLEGLRGRMSGASLLRIGGRVNARGSFKIVTQLPFGLIEHVGRKDRTVAHCLPRRALPSFL
jgi:hypothetical protein